MSSRKELRAAVPAKGVTVKVGSLTKVLVRERSGLLSFLGVPIGALGVFAKALAKGISSEQSTPPNAKKRAKKRRAKA